MNTSDTPGIPTLASPTNLAAPSSDGSRASSSGRRPAPARRTLRALVVDDSRVARRVLSRVLAPVLGQAPLEAGDGAEALEVAAAKGPLDLVITDVHMPRRNGIELIRALRASAETRRTPILVISSDADPDRVVEAIRAGAQGYITKPYRTASIRRRVADAFALADLAGQEPEAGAAPLRASFAGELEQLSFLEVLQFLAVQGKSGDLVVESEGAKASVALRAGAVRWAVATRVLGAPLLGGAALALLARAERGRFRLEPSGYDAPPVPGSAVEGATMPLIFELARLRDEAENPDAAATEVES